MPRDRGPQSRQRDDRRGPGAGPARSGPARSGPPGVRESGPRDSRRRDQGGPRGGPGRDRDAARRPERKLYNVDSVVDRGFEDVDEDSGTRRVHWTIVKRTIADQISRKAVSAAYVVQRDGVDTDFPNLGAARAAVNKTIVHPEKLTRSKAEYAAEKK